MSTTTTTSPTVTGSSIQYWGLGSGMSNIPDIIDALVKTDEIKVMGYQNKQSLLNQQKTGWNNLKIGINNIIDDINKAQKSGLSVRKIDYSDSGYFTATSTVDSSPMDYSIQVSKLAKSQVVKSNKVSDINAALNLSGSFTINGAKVDVIATDSLSSIRNKITQSKDGSGNSLNVRSYIIEGTMFIDNMKTGLNNKLNAVDTDGILSSIGLLDGSGNLNVSQASQDAEFSVNNQIIKRDSNTISDAVTGLTFNLTKETTAPVTMTVGSDKDSVKSYIKNFATSINDLVELSNSYTAYDKDNKTSGILNGDNSVATIRSTVMKDFFGKFTGGTPSFLFELGVSVDKYGKVNVDDTKLNKALDSNYDSVVKSLTNGIDSTSTINTDTTGLFVRIKNDVTKLLDEKNGVFKTKTDSIDKQVKSLDGMITKQNDYVTSRRAALTAQFTAMEKALSLAKNQQKYLDQTFNSKSSDS